MKLLRFAIVLVAASLIAPALNAQELKPLTVDALVAKNIEAKGGIDALRAVQSLRLKGKMLVNQGQIEFAYTQTKKRPGQVRAEATLQGMTLVQAYDGTQGWKISPFGGRKDPEKMSVDDAKSLVEDAEIDGPLVDWEAKGSTVEYLGPEDVDGTLAHKLKVVRKNGDVSYVYLDPDASWRFGSSHSGSSKARRWKLKPISAITKKSPAYFSPSRSKPVPRERPTNKKSFSKKPRPTSRSTTLNLSFPRPLQNSLYAFPELHSFHRALLSPVRQSAPSRRPITLQPFPVSAPATSAPRQ